VVRRVVAPTATVASSSNSISDVRFVGFSLTERSQRPYYLLVLRKFEFQQYIAECAD